ncbi:MAG TPA: acyl-CoA dehydrogenase family protein, partial [Beijerinckiaceae bacterium]|nr:acyl-CoA dehydrogenase family protein [Beijerinckiaceae bacterium]
MMREAARAFAEREIRPIAAELDESERFPAELYA